MGKRVNVEKGNVRRNETRSMINKPTTREKERERASVPQLVCENDGLTRDQQGSESTCLVKRESGVV
jgi:hypothetical protein